MQEKNLTKLGEMKAQLDSIDMDILSLLQRNCKLPLAKIGQKVGLTAPSIIERIRKLEEHGVITGYHAVLDARRLGKDITGFVGVSIRHPRLIEPFVQAVQALHDVLECHHVTGSYTLLLKVKCDNTSALEDLISRIRSIEGVERTETMIALSSPTERVELDLRHVLKGNGQNGRDGEKPHRHPRVR